jgi:hypothetical protein
VLSADFTGRHAPDVDGHTVALVVTVHSYGTVPEGTPEDAYGFVALLKKRDSGAVSEALDQFDAELLRIGLDKGRVVARFHTDIDRSFLAKVRKQAVRKGWMQTDTGGYRSASNGIVERRIGLLKETARAILLACSGGVHYYEQLWGHALVQANYCINRSTRAFQQLTGAPYAWESRDLAFGELVMYHLPKELKAGVYAPPGEYGLWMHRADMATDPQTSSGDVVAPVEWDSSQQAWIVYPVVIATTCKPLGCMPLRMRPKPGMDEGGFSEFLDAMFDPLLSMDAGLEGSVGDDVLLSGVEGRAVVGDAPSGFCGVDVSGADVGVAESRLSVDAEEFVPRGSDARVAGQVLDVKEAQGVRLCRVRWLGCDRRQDSWVPVADVDPALVRSFQDSLATREDTPAVFEHATACCVRRCLWGASWDDGLRGMRRELAGDGGELEEETVVRELLKKHRLSAAGDLQLGAWRRAYRDELDSVSALRLRELGAAEAAGISREQIPGLRMLLSEKRDGRKKARLVLQGFNEPHSWDEGAVTDSPVAYASTIRMMLARSGGSDVVTSRDVSVAFLQSTGYLPNEQKRYCSYRPRRGGPQRFYQLMGPLYGQRSASRRWFKTLSAWLVGQGFEAGCNEPCLFRKEGLTVLVYVDDILTRGAAALTEDFHRALGAEFKCTAEEYLTVDHPLDFLGFTVSKTVDESGVCFYMDQADAVGSFLSAFDFGELQHKASPMPTKALFDSDPILLSENDQAVYRHAVGSLNYFAKATRYDIAFCVSRLSRKMACADVGAWKSLMHLLGYLAGTVGFRIGGLVSMGVDSFHFYVDSDHAGDRSMDSRSQTGFLVFLNSFPVEWVSRRQPVTAVSPAEAEIYAMREVVVAGRLMQWVAEEMGMTVKWPFVVKSDSTQAVSFQRATSPASKLRGCFDLRDLFVKELRDQEVVTSEHVLRDLNVADMLTHPLSGREFSNCLGRAQNLRTYSARGACVYSYLYSLAVES